MHQAITHARLQNLEVIALPSVCASCARRRPSMPPQVILELEQAFKAPLIEAYGMTEATHQMCSNPLPPAVRKPGTVGPSGGPEVSHHGGGRHAAGARARRARSSSAAPNVTAGYHATWRPGLRQWLVPHRRPGRDGRRRLCPSPGGSRSSSTAAARRSARARSTRSRWTTLRGPVVFRHAAPQARAREVAAVVVLRRPAGHRARAARVRGAAPPTSRRQEHTVRRRLTEIPRARPVKLQRIGT